MVGEGTVVVPDDSKAVVKNTASVGEVLSSWAIGVRPSLIDSGAPESPAAGSSSVGEGLSGVPLIVASVSITMKLLDPTEVLLMMVIEWLQK